MTFLRKLARAVLYILLATGLVGGAAAGLVYIVLVPRLPSVETLKDIRLQVPLRILTRDGYLLGEFGETKRSPVRLEDVPTLMIKAVLAAEDDRFFEHPGVDYQGLLRAGFYLLTTGEKRQGGSTITMQVARNFFLSREKTYIRKLNEILLALKIEHQLTKKEILELYLNKIYLGNRAYGIGAAAQTYYGESLDQLAVAELAMIAGLPKAPSAYNPIANPSRAVLRRNYVLERMRQLGFIDEAAYEQAHSAPVSASLHRLPIDIPALYVAEMVRAAVIDHFGQKAYSEGFKVVTTIDSQSQLAANIALQKGLEEYDRRHGYRGPLGHLALDKIPLEPGDWQQLLARFKTVEELQPGVIVHVEEQTAQAILANGLRVDLPWKGLSWARAYIDNRHVGPIPKNAARVLNTGDVVYLEPDVDDQWRLAQAPQVEGALVAMRPNDGTVAALTGGYDFFRSKFNRAIQAARQVGSSIKPFIYSAALEKGYTAASLINDAPVVFNDPGLESMWRPENYSGRFFGPTRLRVALMKSRNLVSIRLLRAIGVPYTINYLTRFGFDTQRLPRNLSLALGSGTATPLEMARAFAVFANGGYLVDPSFIDHVEDVNGRVIWRPQHVRVCPDCNDGTEPDTGNQAVTSVNLAKPAADQDQSAAPAPRVITAQNAYLMTSIMRDVIRHGTGRRARALGRKDIAGKTGTTNDQRDAWFAGFNADMVAIGWVGFDETKSLGDHETGARAALPVWLKFMKQALKGIPEKPLKRPDGLVTVRIDRDTGLLANANNPRAIFETFRTSLVPRKWASPGSALTDSATEPSDVPEQLF